MPVSLNRLKFIAKQWCDLDSAIRTWESLSEEQRGILNFIALHPEEIPLAALVDGPNPLMISSHRVVWLSNEQVIDIDLNRISQIKPRKDWNYDKLGLHTLVITTDDSKQYCLETPLGKACFSIWNLILRFKGHGLGGRRT